MGEGSNKPNKQIKVNANSTSAFNLKVNQEAEIDKQRTLADYVPPEMNDPQIDKAIDDIIVSESNEVLAAEDSIYDESEEAKAKKKSNSKLKKFFKNKWLYIGILAVIIAVFAVPNSRYFILSKFVSKTYSVTVIDSVTDQPVSGASVSFERQTVTTNASGQVKLTLKIGKYSYSISKHYYATTSDKVFIGLSAPKNTTIDLKATGRQVPITVVNKLTGRPLSGVRISILNTTAITNYLGKTEIVLPTKDPSYEATLTTNSFNTLVTSIKVTTSATANIVDMVPIGSIYYLSNASGTINVVKANLDGSNSTVELAGTSQETASTTTLMPSPDWKYLLLEADRSGGQPELYVINTASGKLTEFDSSADNFKLIGWSGDQFVYDAIATSDNTSMSGMEQLKSYDAPSGQLNVIDQDQVLGSSPSYAYQSFSNFELLPNLIVYTTSWNPVGSYSFTSENDTIRGIEPNGLNKEDYSTFPATTTGAMSVIRNQPESLYISVNNTSSNQTSYYTFTKGSVANANISAATFSQTYPTYFVSLSGEESIWSVKQNNQYLTYRANQNGQDSKKVAIPDTYQVYSWYDNVYMLLTKGNELYIAPATGNNSPVLIGSYLDPNAS